jgi:hypothetical protein
VKIHFEESGLFADLSQELKSRFPDLQLCPLKSNSTSSAKNWVFVEENLEPDQLIAEMKMRSLQYILQRNSGRFEKDVLSAGLLFENRAGYFAPEFSFSPDPVVNKRLIKFSAPLEKDRMKKETMEFVDSIGSAGVSQAAEAVIEELYMNAILDAPREAVKKGLTIESSPSEFFLCQTEKTLQVSCSDAYGSLDIQKFLSRMKEVYEKGAGEVINMQGGGGAGLGCVILFEHSCALILGVRPGQQTKVTCLISLGISNRQRAQMKKSLLWFEL